MNAFVAKGLLSRASLYACHPGTAPPLVTRGSRKRGLEEAAPFRRGERRAGLFVSDYMRIYRCKCEHIQRSHNAGICRKCGSECLEPAVGRWIPTTTLWQTFILAKPSGYWELSPNTSPPTKGRKKRSSSCKDHLPQK